MAEPAVRSAPPYSRCAALWTMRVPRPIKTTGPITDESTSARRALSTERQLIGAPG